MRVWQGCRRAFQALPSGFDSRHPLQCFAGEAAWCRRAFPRPNRRVRSPSPALSDRVESAPDGLIAVASCLL